MNNEIAWQLDMFYTLQIVAAQILSNPDLENIIPPITGDLL